MKSNFKCTCCGHEHSFEGVTTIRVRGSRVRLFDDSENPVDICPECGSICEEIKTNKGLCVSWAKTDNGTVGGNWNRS